MSTSGPPRPSPPAQEDRAPHSNLVLVVVGIGTLLSTLAGSSVNLALPVIGQELGIAVELLRWVVLAYMVVVVVLLLGAGRASDLWGHRVIYQAGFVVFGAASLVSGMARSFWTLVLGRALQGAGAALNMSASPALLTSSFPAAQRGRALGLLATATYVGLTIGPPLGGLVIGRVGWRWIFLFNVPATALMVLLGQLCLPRGRRRVVRFDLPGMLTLTTGMPLLLVALTQGQEWGWSAWPTLACGAAGLCLLALFVRVELTRTSPLLDLSIFRAPVFTSALLAALSNYVALFVPIILLPFYLIEALQVSPARAGALLSSMPLVMALIATPAGWLSDRVGTRGLSVLGLALLTVGLAGLSLLGVRPSGQGSLLALGLWLGVMGLGTGIFISPNSSALMGAAPRERQGIAGGVMALARTFGMTVGVSVGTAVFRAAGGRTGAAWREVDLQALGTALYVAAGICLLGALASALRRRAA